MLNVNEKAVDKLALTGVAQSHASTDLMDRALGWANTACHMVAAFWLFALAILITLDVASRSLLNAPFTGTAEIVANSIVSIVFLQLPSAVRSGGMLRAEVLDAFVSDAFKHNMQRLASVLGALLFLAVAYSAWHPMVEAWKISEFAGNESTVQIPLFPIRLLLVVASVLAAIEFLLTALGRSAAIEE